MAVIRYNPKVQQYIESLPLTLRIQVADTLAYLARHGRSAVLPDVRHCIAGNPNLTETRNQDTDITSGQRWTIRCLLVFHTDDTLLACVIGDKDNYNPPAGQDWYDVWVPVASTIYEHMKESL
jgi:hypothetical protein